MKGLQENPTWYVVIRWSSLPTDLIRNVHDNDGSQTIWEIWNDFKLRNHEPMGLILSIIVNSVIKTWARANMTY